MTVIPIRKSILTARVQIGDYSHQRLSLFRATGNSSTPDVLAMAHWNTLSARYRITILVTAVTVLVVAAVWAALVILRPLPPRTVVMATGPEGDAHYEIGLLYKELFAQEGIDLILRTTAAETRNVLFEQLDRLEKKADSLRVPQPYANQLYTLRDHIILVRDRLARNAAATEK